MVARFQKGEKQRGDSRHAGTEADDRRRSFQCADSFFQRIDGRVRDTRIAEALIDANGVMGKDARLKERKEHGTGVRIERTATVNGGGGSIFKVCRHCDLLAIWVLGSRNNFAAVRTPRRLPGEKCG
jgi:hypothetical protein